MIFSGPRFWITADPNVRIMVGSGRTVLFNGKAIEPVRVPASLDGLWVIAKTKAANGAMPEQSPSRSSPAPASRRKSWRTSSASRSTALKNERHSPTADLVVVAHPALVRCRSSGFPRRATRLAALVWPSARSTAPWVRCSGWCKSQVGELHLVGRGGAGPSLIRADCAFHPPGTIHHFVRQDQVVHRPVRPTVRPGLIRPGQDPYRSPGV